MSLEGKHATVTGAGSGIGAALCRALASAGADVLCTDIDGDAATFAVVNTTNTRTAVVGSARRSWQSA